MANRDETDVITAFNLLALRNAGLDEGQAEKFIMKANPKLKPEDAWRGTLLLKKAFFTEKLKNSLLKDLKSEMKDWDRLSNESLKRFE